MGPSPNLWFLDAKLRLLDQNNKSLLIPDISYCFVHSNYFGAELQVSVGPRPHLSLCACKTACLASELLVSMGSSPHLWIFDAKQRLLDQNYKSLWLPDLTCRFVHAKQRD